MSELLKPITRHDICSAINAASNERFVPYAVHADLKAKYEKCVSVLKRYESITVYMEDGDTFVAADVLEELGEE